MAKSIHKMSEISFRLPFGPTLWVFTIEFHQLDHEFAQCNI